MVREVLVRFGAIPEVGRFQCALQTPLARGQCVVIETHRGLELGEVLDPELSRQKPPDRAAALHQAPSQNAALPVFRLLRPAASQDHLAFETHKQQARSDYALWVNRIGQWNLALELLDLEWTLDRQKLILYVIGGRGADTTRLALQAATVESVVVEVQPVTSDGLVRAEGSACGSHCGCNPR